MLLTPGTRLGVYQVTGQIGAGGMGEVYKARDTKLDRDVALKILPDAFVNDAERLARFQREAKVLASLNHPNIAAIHGLEESGDSPALVLEYVPGPTLQDRIAKGPIPLDEALPIARQIAEALEAAHEQGIIHRDLKPANVKVKADGTVKVLDFGLAKALQPELSDTEAANSPTMTMTAAATKMGVIMGTAAYMAPEQAKGRQMDKRADIWAFGVVLFEMLTGRQAFGATDISQTLALVLTREIEWTALPSKTPASVRRMLRRCVTRDRKNRLADISVARLEIDEADEPQEALAEAATGPVTSPALWQRPIPAAVAVLLVAVVAGLAVSALLGSDTQPSPKRFTLTLPDSDRLPVGGGNQLAISPDGQTLVYRAIRDGTVQLFRRPIDQFEATPMPGTEGGLEPFFSPDGQWVGFFANGALLKVALAGGPAQTLTALPSQLRGADWGADDMIVYGTDQGLMQVPAAGGDPTPLFTPDDQQSSWYPQVLAGRDTVLFTTLSDTGELHLLMLETGEHRTMIPDAVTGRVLDTGHLVFARSGALWAVPFDRDRLDIVGTPVPVVEGVRVSANVMAQFALADDGSLVYIPRRRGRRKPQTRVGRSRRRRGIACDPR